MAKNVAFRKVKKSKAGRPPKLTTCLIEDVCKLVRGGAYIETAVVLCDINKTTFYRWIKESHKIPECNATPFKDKTKEEKTLMKMWRLKTEFRNAVAKAIEESTMRDVMNIDKAAMGRAHVFETYPENTEIPLQDHLGKIQTDSHGEPIYVDVSGKVMTDLKGKPVVKIQGQEADWKASAWRLEKRVPKDWGQSSTLTIEKPDPLKSDSEEDPNKIEFVFVNPNDGVISE